MSDPKKARCYDKNWRYTRHEATDLQALFKRIRREMAEAAKKQPANVKPIKAKEKRNA